jgi:protein transport protein SEC23
MRTRARTHIRSKAARAPAAAARAQVVDQLGVRPTAPSRPGAGPGHVPGPPRRQFILPLSDPACETSINNILTDLQRDAYPVMSNERPTRCTGTALQVRGALAGGLSPGG